MQDIDSQLDAVLEEYKYVHSMIPLYRGFQNQSIRFLFIIYAALIVLLGSQIGGQFDPAVTMKIVAFVPWIVEIIIVSWLMFEIRIIRASLFIQKRTTAKVDALTNSIDLLRWEMAPSRYISKIEKILAGAAFVLSVLVLPALGAGVMVSIELTGLFFYIAFIGTILLLITTIGASYESTRQEWRNSNDHRKEIVVSVSGNMFDR